MQSIVTSGMGHWVDFRHVDIANALVWRTHQWIFWSNWPYFGLAWLVMCEHGALPTELLGEDERFWTQRRMSWSLVLQSTVAPSCFAISEISPYRKLQSTHKRKKRNRNKPAPVISIDFSLSRLLYGLKNFFFRLLVKQCSLELSQ